MSTVHNRVINAYSTTPGFFSIEELQETIAILALGLLVSSDDCLEDVVPERLYMLV